MSEENKDDWADDFIKTIVPLISKIKTDFKNGEIKADTVYKGVCPKCEKELEYAISSHNRHTRGVCITENCVNWIE